MIRAVNPTNRVLKSKASRSDELVYETSACNSARTNKRCPELFLPIAERIVAMPSVLRIDGSIAAKLGRKSAESRKNITPKRVPYGTRFLLFSPRSFRWIQPAWRFTIGLYAARLAGTVATETSITRICWSSRMTRTSVSSNSH